MVSIRPVVLCGGSGSRLWPASRPDRPKPLLRLVEPRTLLAATVDRFRGPPLVDPWVVCGVDHADAVGAELPGVRRLVEEVPRGTAGAVTLAARTAAPDDVLLVVPADHVVHQPEVLREAVIRAAPTAAEGWIVTFGVVPTSPATGYGWIEPGEPLAGDVRRVLRFVEKPDRPTAEGMLAGGRHLWNSGMFLFRAGTMLEELDRWAGGRAGSLDVLVMERTRLAAVTAVACGWSDVGTWGAVAAAAPSAGPVTVEGSPGTFVWSDGPRVAVFGAPGLVVVASGGGVLVSAPDHADRCATLGSPASERVDQGPGWEVLRTRLAAGEALVVAEPTVVASGAAPGTVLPMGRFVAAEPTVVVTIRTRSGPGAGSGAG